MSLKSWLDYLLLLITKKSYPNRTKAFALLESCIITILFSSLLILAVPVFELIESLSEIEQKLNNFAAQQRIAGLRIAPHGISIDIDSLVSQADVQKKQLSQELQRDAREFVNVHAFGFVVLKANRYTGAVEEVIQVINADPSKALQIEDLIIDNRNDLSISVAKGHYLDRTIAMAVKVEIELPKFAQLISATFFTDKKTLEINRLFKIRNVLFI